MEKFLLVFGILASAEAYFFKLKCPDESVTTNPFFCSNPNTCDDRVCSEADKICCAVTTPGQCGYQCVVGIYLGCFETFWRCYGTQATITPPLPNQRNGPLLYIDNQDAVVQTPGLATRIEYYVDRPGVEIEFFMLDPVGSQFRYRKTSYSTTHTATTSGAQAVRINWRLIRPDLRFAFRTSQSGVFPIPYALNKQRPSDGGYHSFLLPYTNSVDLQVPLDQQTGNGVNFRFMARICINETTHRVDDSFCPYNPQMSTTTEVAMSTTTSQTTSGSDNNCRSILVDRAVGCIGQGAPQNPGNMIQRVSAQNSYSMIDMTGSGELRVGVITSLEYRVIRLLDTDEQLWFRVWGPLTVGGSDFELIHSVSLNPQEINTKILLGSLNLVVQNKMRLGFSFYSPNSQATVPIRYLVTNEVDENGNDKGIPYTAAECSDVAGCAKGVAVGARRTFSDRNHLVRKQFRIRPCMIVKVPATTCGPQSVTTPTTTSTTTTTTMSSTTSGPCIICPAGPPGPPGPSGNSGTASGRRRRDLYEPLLIETGGQSEDTIASLLFSVQNIQLLVLLWNTLLTIAIVLLPLYVCRRQKMQF